MSEKESIENNTPQESPDSVIRDIAHEFQVILDSVEGESNFTHDRFLRFAFADPERMAELLTLFSRHNPTLKAFLDTIDLSTLHGASENFSSDKHVGYSDLVFEAQIKDGGTAALYVGIIAEHKSSEDSEVMKQISEYYHHLYLERKKDVPVVAFIVYNGENDWNPLSETHYAEYPEFYHDIGYPFKVEFLDVGHAIDDKELKDFSPFTLVALTAMKYIGAKVQYMTPRSYWQVTCQCDPRLSIFGMRSSSRLPSARLRCVCSSGRIRAREGISSSRRFHISCGSGLTSGGTSRWTDLKLSRTRDTRPSPSTS